jgi:ATP-dependent DNA helicase RecQ
MPTKEAILKEYFGYDTFRPLQADIIDTVLSGKDAMVLMPTGGGKSLCFQVPAMVLDGMCIVISPLIALMKDQVQALRANGIASAFINSSLSSSEQNALERQCLDGKMKLLYIAPEKLFSGGFIDFVKRLNISLIAIDEAHCISFWGHDFRPEYAQLKVLKTHFPGIPIIALTATADKVTRKDILSQLGIEKAQTFISSFDRPNLSLTVLPARKRLESIVYFLEKHKNQAGIIYCLSRKTTEELAEKLQKSGFKAKHYHAGMDANYRSNVQDEFIKDDIQIICATIAFGMGIDKSNVRWIVHYNLPKNIESFYQEIGRAGRDGLPGDTVLFYSYSDVAMQMDMLKDLTPERRELQAAKLERMKQYAEADICRRRILISYFNETVEKDCGNCDVCKNPKVKTDATLMAQKALSAIARTDEKVAMTMLIDVLRGSHNQTLLEKGYDKLKTFGAGRELKSDEWAHYISQMLNSGIVDIAYDEAHAFRLNNTSWQVLKENKQVTLTKYEPFYAKQEKPLDLPPTKTKKEVLSDDLFERLRKVRKELADSQNVPAYVIFSDKTLTEMALDKPMNEIDLLNISGVGHQKFNLYGDYFLKEIIAFVKEKSAEGSKIDGATYFLTHELYKKGYGIEEMAQERNLNPVTIISHLAKLYSDGHDIDLKKYVTDTEEKVIKQALKELGVSKGSALKPVFEHLQEKYEYYKIRIVCAIMEKNASS